MNLKLNFHTIFESLATITNWSRQEHYSDPPYTKVIKKLESPAKYHPSECLSIEHNNVERDMATEYILVIKHVIGNKDITILLAILICGTSPRNLENRLQAS